MSNNEVEILLTTDRTLMSNHHQNEFLGFGATAASSVVPEWLYRGVFFPPLKTNGGVPVEAPYGLRKVEAQLMIDGFDVLTRAPRRLLKSFLEGRLTARNCPDSTMSTQKMPQAWRRSLR